VGFYGKNVTDTERVLSRTQVPLTAGYRVASSVAALQTAVPGSATTNYRTVSVTAPREFGINVRWSFGSR
jgi:iron complex outermembrane receptor protein